MGAPAKEKLSHFHIFILTYMTQVGIGIFGLPNLLATYFGTNGWLALFFLLGISSLNIFLIHLVHRLGNGQSILTILEASLPRFLLVPIYLSFIVVWSMFGCLVIREYILILQMISFQTTPTFIFKILIDCFLALILIKGIYVISKSSTVFFFLVIWLVLLEIFVLKEFEFARLTPFLFKDDTDFIKGSISTYFSFLGYELSIFFFPYIDNKSRFSKAVLKGNIFTTLVYLSVSVISFGFFSYDELRNITFPLLDLLSYIKLPFIERIENLLFGFFLFLVVCTSVMYYWASLEVAQRILPGIKVNVIGFLLVIITFFASMKFEVLSEVQKTSSLLAKIEIGIAFGLPLFLLVILFFKRRKQQSA